MIPLGTNDDAQFITDLTASSVGRSAGRWKLHNAARMDPRFTNFDANESGAAIVTS